MNAINKIRVLYRMFQSRKDIHKRYLNAKGYILYGTPFARISITNCGLNEGEHFVVAVSHDDICSYFVDNIVLNEGSEIKLNWSVNDGIHLNGGGVDTSEKRDVAEVGND